MEIMACDEVSVPCGGVTVARDEVRGVCMPCGELHDGRGTVSVACVGS